MFLFIYFSSTGLYPITLFWLDLNLESCFFFSCLPVCLPVWTLKWITKTWKSSSFVGQTAKTTSFFISVWAVQPCMSEPAYSSSKGQATPSPFSLSLSLDCHRILNIVLHFLHLFLNFEMNRCDFDVENWTLCLIFTRGGLMQLQEGKITEILLNCLLDNCLNLRLFAFCMKI